MTILNVLKLKFVASGLDLIKERVCKVLEDPIIQNGSTNCSMR